MHATEPQHAEGAEDLVCGEPSCARPCTLCRLRSARHRGEGPRRRRVPGGPSSSSCCATPSAFRCNVSR